MILLTKLNGTSFLINLESVKYIEQTPDTVIQMINGDSVIVKENLEEIMQKVVQHRADILRAAQMQP